MEAPRRLTYGRISFVLRLFGLGVGVAGGCVLWTGRHDEPFWGFLCVLVGIAITFGRSAVSLDFEKKTCTQTWGIFVPWNREVRPFKSFRVVAIYGQKRGQRSTGSAYVFPIELRGEGADVKLLELGDYTRARRRAHDFALWMGLGLNDHGVERQPGFVDEPLRDRLLRKDEVPGALMHGSSDPFRSASTYKKAPEAPTGTKVVATDGLDELEIAIPKRFRIGGFGIFGIVMMSVFAPIVVMLLPTAQTDSWAVEIVPGFVLLLALVLGVAPWLRAATTRWRVTVGRGYLNVARSSLFGTRNTSFPIPELDDVHVASADEPRYHNLTRRTEYPAQLPFVVVRSDRRAVAFGAGLSREELDWLVARIQHAVATRPLKH
jgi:hypothetical protein